MIRSDTIRLNTRGQSDIHDLTSRLEDVVKASGIRAGSLTVFTPSSTSAITTIEYEPGALDDLQRAFEEIAPVKRDYRHNLAWGDGNGSAHLRAALLGPSLTVPILDGRLTLGTWQQIIFIDFDIRPRQRQIVVQVMGEES
jgi:secondary thiamine-phosphate synthase enzyme